MSEHTTHHDDCGCKSAQFAAEIARLRAENEQLRRERDAALARAEKAEAWSESLVDEVCDALGGSDPGEDVTDTARRRVRMIESLRAKLAEAQALAEKRGDLLRRFGDLCLGCLTPLSDHPPGPPCPPALLGMRSDDPRSRRLFAIQAEARDTLRSDEAKADGGQPKPTCETCGDTKRIRVGVGSGPLEEAPCPDCQPKPEEP